MSSISDIDSMELSASALEEALLSNIRHKSPQRSGFHTELQLDSTPGADSPGHGLEETDHDVQSWGTWSPNLDPANPSAANVPDDTDAPKDSAEFWTGWGHHDDVLSAVSSARNEPNPTDAAPVRRRSFVRTDVQSWATWRPNSAFSSSKSDHAPEDANAPEPPPPVAPLLTPGRGSPGLFGPRSPRESFLGPDPAVEGRVSPGLFGPRSPRESFVGPDYTVEERVSPGLFGPRSPRDSYEGYFPEVANTSPAPQLAPASGAIGNGPGSSFLMMPRSAFTNDDMFSDAGGLPACPARKAAPKEVVLPAQSLSRRQNARSSVIYGAPNRAMVDVSVADYESEVRGCRCVVQ